MALLQGSLLLCWYQSWAVTRDSHQSSTCTCIMRIVVLCMILRYVMRWNVYVSQSTAIAKHCIWMILLILHCWIYNSDHWLMRRLLNTSSLSSWWVDYLGTSIGVWWILLAIHIGKMRLREMLLLMWFIRIRLRSMLNLILYLLRLISTCKMLLGV